MKSLPLNITLAKSQRFLHKLTHTETGQRTVWLRPAIMAATLLLSLMLALISKPTLSLLVGAAVVGIPVIFAFLRWPQVGLLALVLVSFLAPSPFPLGGAAGAIHSGILFTVVLTVLWILDMLTRQKRFALTPSSTNVPMVVFMIIAILALLNGQINYYYLARLASPFAQISGTAVFILSGAAYFLGANQIKKQIWLERITWLYILIGALYILGRITPLTEGLIRPIFQYGSDSSLFWNWLLALAASQALLNTKLEKRLRLVLGIVVAATLYVSLVQNYLWKSGWLPPVAALGVIIFLGMPRFRLAVLVAGLVLLGVLIAGSDIFTSSEDYSILTRVEAWKLIWKIVQANPILGLGMSNYYWYTPLFPILGYAVNFNSHNNYIDIIAQTGLVGLFTFTWFVAAYGWLGWRLKAAVPEGFARAYVIGALGGLAGMLVSGMLGDWVLPFVYNVGLHGMRASIMAWFFLGGLVMFEQIYLRKERSR